jgi:hypothetical protein
MCTHFWDVVHTEETSSTVTHNHTPPPPPADTRTEPVSASDDSLPLISSFSIGGGFLFAYMFMNSAHICTLM